MCINIPECFTPKMFDDGHINLNAMPQRTGIVIKNDFYVVEVNRPDRSKRRLEGKSDTLDAENAARTVLSGSSKAKPKMQSGACEALRIISVARRSAVKARTQAINQLRALLVVPRRMSVTNSGNRNHTNA